MKQEENYNGDSEEKDVSQIESMGKMFFLNSQGYLQIWTHKCIDLIQA